MGVGGRGAEYVAGGNEQPRQLPKWVTNHPPCPNPPKGDLMDHWSQYGATEVHAYDKSNTGARLVFEAKLIADNGLPDAFLLSSCMKSSVD